MRAIGRITAVLALAGIGMCSGCLVVSGNSVEQSGTRISGETLNQVTPGQTTEQWLIATLGEPCERTAVDETDERTVEILKYKYSVTHAEGGAVFLIFAGGSTKQTTTTTYFEVVDGLVTRYWSET